MYECVIYTCVNTWCRVSSWGHGLVALRCVDQCARVPSEDTEVGEGERPLPETAQHGASIRQPYLKVLLLHSPVKLARKDIQPDREIETLLMHCIRC